LYEAIQRRSFCKLTINEGNDLRKQNYSFVVRIWLESAERSIKERPVWRGSIEQVGSASRIFFSDFKEINRFIEEKIGVETDPVSSGLQEELKNIQVTFKNYCMGLVHKLFRR
jgi:hypothetical protein